MGRWKPGAKDRLRLAALDLFLDQGFERTTVEQIAGAAGLTERTFFRYYEDKREVLFDGREALERAFLGGVADAPEDAAPMAVVATALEASASFFPDDGREWSRRRQRVIAANAALRERELLKLAGLAELVARALDDRGVPAAQAVLAAESGLTVFGLAFAQWIEEGETRSFADLQREALATLRALAGSAGIA